MKPRQSLLEFLVSIDGLGRPSYGYYCRRLESRVTVARYEISEFRGKHDTMFKDRFLHAFVLLVAVACLAAGADAQTTKSRYFYNDDGDRGVFLLKGPFHRRQLNYPVDVLVGTPVTTLVYCANFGSDQAYYPSKFASALGWREVENTRRNPRYTYFNRIHEIGAYLRKHKIDLLATVMRRAKSQGLEFVPSLRMNDTHFLNKVPPLKHPLTGEFWLKNRNLTINGGALDFTHKKVRDYRLGQMFELIDGYATDGFEMDFSRQPRLFPAGKGRSKQNLVTEMVRKARQRLDARSKKDGKKRFLIVRVPHTLNLCQFYGFDLGTWFSKNLIDYLVIASPDRYFQFDMPLSDFLALAKRTKSRVRVIASPDSYKATPAMYRAGMANYYSMGQRDTYLFNFFTARSEPRTYYPFRNEDYALLRDLKSPVTLWGRPKHFMSDGWFPGKGVTLQATGKKYNINLYVGEDVALAARENILKKARLQVLLAGGEKYELQVALNGKRLAPSTKAGNSIAFDLKKQLPNKGSNTVTVVAKAFKKAPVVRGVELITDYDISGVERLPQ